ncbi:hypothetical protein PPACK8108_LOCUS5330, partial [Phakopsora pachyrhizi]
QSMCGYIIMLYGVQLVWPSKRQTLVATSTAHEELMSIAYAVRESVWLKCTME